MGGPRCPRDRRHLQMLAHARDRRPASSATLSGKQSAKTRSQHRSFDASGDSTRPQASEDYASVSLRLQLFAGTRHGQRELRPGGGRDRSCLHWVCW